MRYLSLLITLLLVTNLIAQRAGNFVPLEYEGLTPQWTHASVDSTIIDHIAEDARDVGIGFDGYSHIHKSDNIEHRPLIADNYLYQVSRTIYDIDISGGLIEKIDLRTGEKLWQSTFDLRTSDYREYIERTILKEDTLILINYKITVPDSPTNFFPIVGFAGFGGEGVLKIRKYNIETGDLISENTANQFDPKVKFLQVGPDDSAQINLLGDSLLEVVQFSLDRDGIKVFFDTINYQGLLVNEPDTLYSIIENADWKKSWWYNGNRVIKSDDGVLYWVDGIVPNDNTPRHEAYIVIMDGKSTKRVSLNELPLQNNQIFRWYLVDVTEDYLMMRIGYFNNDDVCDYVVLDRDGQFIQRLKTDYCNTNYPYKNDKGEFVSMSFGGKIDDVYHINFNKFDGEEIVQMSNFGLKNPGYATWPNRLYPLKDGDYLVELFNTEITETSTLGRFYHYLRVSPQDIGFESVAVQEVKKQSLDFDIIPNPNHGIFQVQFDQNLSGKLTLYNSAGMLISSSKINGQANISFDISDLASGFYFVNFTNELYTSTQKVSIIN